MSILPGTTGRRRLYLMRHGHVDYFAPKIATIGGIRDISLTPQGRDEAEAAALALSAVVLDRVFCSGLPRARQTAEIVVEHQARLQNIEAESALSEIRGGRLLDVSNRSELIATMVFHFARAGEDGATMLEGGEAFAGAQERAVGVVRRILGESGWRQILIVAHEG
ncbi:MAG TPA: histidine phosphatase family protein, partial [Rhizomicrobium sp.]|nr:histidine phosphatase family protein [Rhizomicrobium sp.]